MTGQTTGREPQVSVVMSVYNGASYLTEALESILTQDLTDLELLVVDDGSTDATPDILDRCDDPRVRVMHQPNRGYVSAFQRATALATAPLLARMDADDVCSPDRLSRQVAFLAAHPEVGLLGTGGRVIDVAGDPVRTHVTFWNDFAIRLALLRGNPFLHGSVVFRRALFDAVGGYRHDYYPAEDFDLWCRMAVSGTKLANLPDELYGYRIHDESVSAQERRVQDDAARRVRDTYATTIASTLLQPDTVRRAAAAYVSDPDPRVRAEWPIAVRMLEHALLREARAGQRALAVRAFATAVAVSPTTAIRVALRELADRASRERTTPPARPVTTAPRRLSVMFVLDSLGPGGTERSTALLLEPLRRREIDAEVVCLRHTDDGDEARVVAAGFPVHVLEARTFAGRVRELRRLIRARRPDVVHTAIYGADVAGRVAAIGTGVPVISSLISTPYDPARRNDPRITPWKLEVTRAIDGFTARRLTARLHAVSEGTAAANCRDLHLDRASVTVVGRGRPIDEFTPADPASRAAGRARLGIDEHDAVILALGRQAFAKGFPDLVEAAPLIVGWLPSARILIAGAAGPATPDIERARAALPADVAERVQLLGHRSDVADLLHASDAFVMPSRWEGTAGALLEAFACGVPVVATAVDGLQGVATDGHDAILVPPADPPALAGALRQVIEDRALAARLGANGRETFERRFTLEPSADEMAALYRQVAPKGDPATGR